MSTNADAFDDAPMTPEFSEGMGDGTGIDPVEDARRPKQRRGIFLAAISVAVLLVVMITIALRNRQPETAVATGPKNDNLHSGEVVAVPRKDTVAAPAVVDTVRVGADTSRKLIDTTQLVIPAPVAPVATGAGVPAVPAPVPAPAPGAGTPGVPANPGVAIDPVTGQPIGGLAGAGVAGTGVAGTPGVESGPGAGGSPVLLTPAQQAQARAARRDSVRNVRLAEAAARQAREDSVIAAAEARLRRPTQIALGGGEGGGTNAATARAGQSRFGDEAGATGAPAGGSTGAGEGASAGAGAAAAGGTVDGVEVTPGTRVMAVTTTEYRSDLGSQMLEARLTSPLVQQGRTLLPSGTRLYGSASITTPGLVGQASYVQVKFNTAVTPAGRVIRDLSATAGDPSTYNMAVRGSTNQHVAERVGRGLLATAVDLAVTAGSTQRLSVFQTPSPRDLAKLQIQQRALGVFQPLTGNERSIPASVTLRRGTPMVLFFGF